jgi:hypothetical protein
LQEDREFLEGDEGARIIIVKENEAEREREANMAK